MTIGARKEYLQAITVRYKNATKKGKSRILDEFCAVCKYNRKHAIRLLTKGAPCRRKKPGPSRKYGPEVEMHLVILWERMDRMCSVRMKEALPVWLLYYHENELTEEIKVLLLQISSSTIDRILKAYRSKRGLSTTKPGAFVKSQIPIELLDGHVKEPGYVEADTVAHCGNSLCGEFVNTLTVTDLYCGWTENRALWTKSAEAVLEQLKDIRRSLPFRMKGFACDNGSEFINYSLVKYFEDRKAGPVKFTRRRPYKKNDAAHVEQKNDTHVRRIFGYSRLDHEDYVDLMNDIYKNFWNPLLNYFCPVMKLKRKERIGGKVKKYYDRPKSPFQRLMESGMLTELQRKQLQTNMELLNPFTLKEGLEKKMKIFSELLAKQKALIYQDRSA